jgi:dephospho-CoA kinase
MAEQEARARIAAQAPREQRNAAADRLIDNSAGPEDLEKAVAELWRDLEGNTAQS